MKVTQEPSRWGPESLPRRAQTARPGHTCAHLPGAPPSHRAAPAPATLSERLEVTRSDFRHRKRALGRGSTNNPHFRTILEARLRNALRRAWPRVPSRLQALPPSGRGFSRPPYLKSDGLPRPGSSRKSASWQRFHLRVRKRRQMETRRHRKGDGKLGRAGPDPRTLTADGGSEEGPTLVHRLSGRSWSPPPGQPHQVPEHCRSGCPAICQTRS